MSKFLMYVLSDIHYISHKMWEEGEPINARERGDQIAVKCTPEIFDSFCEKIIADKETNNVLITGDLINNGELQSHLDFIDALKKLTSAGKKVYVVTGTHDYSGGGRDENFFKGVLYKKESTEDAESVYKTDLPVLYADFGQKMADSVHESSGSYSVSVQPGFRLIGIYDNGNGRSHCGLFEDGFTWLRGELERAKKNEELVFLATHHPVIPPWPLYSSIVEFEMFGGYKELRKIMCEYKVKVIFTGHTHIHGIRLYEDAENRSFYDVATTALPAAWGKMRKVVFDKENGKCFVESVGIEKIKDFDTGGRSASEYIYSLNFSGTLEYAMRFRKSDWNKFSSAASAVFGSKLMTEHEKLMKTVFAIFDNAKMSLLANIGGRRCGLSKTEKILLKNEYVKDVVFEILKHVFSGNAPYTPDTPEYKALTGFMSKVDWIMRIFKVDLSKKLKGQKSLTDILVPFLYNVRTGDDDKIVIDLKKN